MTTPRFGARLLGEDVFVPVGAGRSLRAMVAGTGDDLVVLETGLGFSGLTWQPVHARLAEHARVVAYERAGFGDSAPADDPRDLFRLANDLVTVVDAVPHARLVLVGHSWGGPLVRVAAARLLARGEDVARVVLVDPADEHADLYFGRVAAAGNALQGSLLTGLARVGLLGRVLRPMASGMAEPARSAAIAASATRAAAAAAASEMRGVQPGLTQLRQTPPDLQDVPVTVISGTRRGRLGASARDQLVDAHRRTAAAQARGRWVAADRSGHLVPFTEPGLVVDEALGRRA